MPLSLVTGGTGFIGSHCVEALLERGHDVRVLDDLSTGLESNLDAVRSRIQLLLGNIVDPTAVQSAMEGCDCVFHLAALPSVSRSVLDPRATHEACATGTLNILSAAHAAGVRRVVYAGSSSAYGGSTGKPCSEADPVSPRSPYAAAKLAGEHYCESFTSSYGLETVRLRFFNIFGPRQRADSPYSGVIPLFIRSFRQGEAPTIFGDGRQSRDFTYVDNAVQALCLAAHAPKASGKVYNVGTGKNISLLDLVKHLNEMFGTALSPCHAPERSGDVRHSLADIRQTEADLRYRPNVSFLEGLHCLVKGTADET